MNAFGNGFGRGWKGSPLLDFAEGCLSAFDTPHSSFFWLLACFKGQRRMQTPFWPCSIWCVLLGAHRGNVVSNDGEDDTAYCLAGALY